MQCNEVRDQLSLLVYDELDEHAATSVCSHVQKCASCKSELEDIQAAKQAMNTWSDVEADEPVGAVLDRISVEDGLPMVVTTAQPGRRWRLTPWLVGAAAGLAVTLTVLAVGANVRTGDGQLTISFGHGNEPATQQQPTNDTTELTAAQLEQLRAMFTEHGNRQTAFALDLVDDRLREFEGTHDQQFLALVHTIREMREEDMQRFEQALTAVALDSREQTKRTRDALSDVVRTFAMGSPVGNDYNEQMNVKEIIP